MNPWCLETWLDRHIAWSAATFGPGPRTMGILRHIEKELAEIEKNPLDLFEWIDVIILALDGAWRHGHMPSEIVGALFAKQAINFSRDWPPPGPEDQPSEHLRAPTGSSSSR
jgi:hypothetical protein